MMLLERWAVALVLGGCLASTAGAPGQSPASPNSQNTQQTQQNPNQDQDQNQDQNREKNKQDNKQDLDDAEPEEFHPPAEIGQPAAPSPPVESHPSTAPNPPVESHPPVQVESRPPAPASLPVQAVAAKPAPPPDPPLSSNPQERQLQIDAAHLLQLTEELKAELDKAGNNTLSLAALRKADEVQKLARGLKERMKDRGQVIQSKP